MNPGRSSWRSYGLSELAEFGRLWIILAAVDIRLALLPERANRAWILGRRGGGPAAAPSDWALAEAERLAVLARKLSRYRLRSATPCLALAIALRCRLSSLRLRPQLELGARRRPGVPDAIDAHAWLRVGDRVIDPLGGAPGFKRLESLAPQT